MYNDEMRVADFLGEPHIAIVKALFLEFQPTFLDILPLYILLLVIFPVILVGLRLQPLLVLIPSFLVYGFVQMTGVSVPAYPEGHVWYFNPLAWQFLFTAGAALGLGLPLFQPWLRSAGALLYVAIAITALGLVIKLSWTIHLEIFCLGILLSALGHFVLSEYDSGIVIQLGVNAVGVLLLFLTAKMIDWYKAMGRSPQPGSRALTIWRRGDIEP
jgi:hypothetical protein